MSIRRKDACEKVRSKLKPSCSMLGVVIGVVIGVVSADKVSI